MGFCWSDFPAELIDGRLQCRVALALLVHAGHVVLGLGGVALRFLRLAAPAARFGFRGATGVREVVAGAQLAFDVREEGLL